MHQRRNKKVILSFAKGLINNKNYCPLNFIHFFLATIDVPNPAPATKEAPEPPKPRPVPTATEAKLRDLLAKSLPNIFPIASVGDAIFGDSILGFVGSEKENMGPEGGRHALPRGAQVSPVGNV